jgi:prepilin-type N-terminal cleavage/methylation domain-containing protein
VRRPRPAGRARARGDDGLSLPEVLVTVMIVGIAFVAILAALAVTIRTSRTHEVSADTNTLLVGAAEAVKAADFCDPLEGCVPADAYAAAVAGIDRPTGWDAAEIDIASIVPVTGADRTVHQVTVGVTSPGSETTRSITVAKTAPPPPPPSTAPPPTDVCDATTVTARAFWLFFGFVLVEVDIPPDPDACLGPIRARVAGSSSSIALGSNPSQPTRWSGWVLAWECFFPNCDIEVLQGDNTPVMTVPVEFGWF